jgi:two-component system chemotaxis response regulator CheB
MNQMISPKDKIRVLIVDDSAVMRRIIMTTLLRHADIEVVGTAEDGLEAIEMIGRIKPDLITLDVEMPKMDGFGVCFDGSMCLFPANNRQAE